MRGLVATLEQHHKVRILDEAVSEAVRLSARYIPARQLPDKAVSLLDTACARVAMSQNAIPAADRRSPAPHRPDRHRARRSSNARWRPAPTIRARRDELTAERPARQRRTGRAEERWEDETRLVTEIDAVRGSIDAAPAARSAAAGSAGHGAAGSDGQAERAKLAELSTRLRALQGEQPLIFPRGRRSGDRRDRRGMDRHSGRPHAVRRDPHRAQPARSHGAPRHRPEPRPGSRRASHPHQPRRLDRSAPADRRLPARRHVGRRQDRNGPHASPSCSMAASRT